jgi:hypothetical protein
MYEITLRWCYKNGNWYEFHSNDAAQVGALYRLKILENEIEKVEVLKGDFVIIEWAKQKD